MKKYIKLFFFITTIITTNVFGYQAITAEGSNVEQYASKLQDFLSDYTAGYKVATQPRNSRTFIIGVGRTGDVQSDKILNGSQGQGTYSAIGGQEFIINYRIIGWNEPYYLHVFPVAKKTNVFTDGITGQHLHGTKLYELFEIAELLEDYSAVIAPIFSENINDSRVTELKNALIDFKYKGVKTQGLINILTKIEPNGKYGVILDKNYSEAAVNVEQVNAINQLNGAIESLYKQLITDKYSLFFKYIAAFIDNGGTSDANVILDDNQNLALPKFQVYVALPTEEEFMQALVVGDNQIFNMPRELTIITNEHDLRRILGEPYRENYTGTEKFKQLYEQAKQKNKIKQLENYDLAI